MENTTTQNLFKIATLLALLFILWGSISFIFGCNFVPIPFSCDVYYGILRFNENGQPKVLIVYGDGGLGNHELLQRTMEDPAILGLHPRSTHIDTVSVGNLRDYDLVIVEEARKIPSDKLKMFMEYVNFGGRLVWTGDAGTQLDTGDEPLLEFERGKSDSNSYGSGWARKQGGKVVAFDEFLGLDYLGNFCKVKLCLSTPYIGVLDAPDRQNKFVYSLRPNLKMYGDFSLVKLRGDAPSKVILNINAGGNIIADASQQAIPEQQILGGSVQPLPPAIPECSDGIDNDFDSLKDYPQDGDCSSASAPTEGKRSYGKILPVIVQNGFGGRIVYYSIPPEFFVSDGMPVDPGTGERIKYTSFIENIYYGFFG